MNIGLRGGVALVIGGLTLAFVSAGMQMLAGVLQGFGMDFSIPFLPLMLWIGIVMSLIGALLCGYIVSRGVGVK